MSNYEDFLESIDNCIKDYEESMYPKLKIIIEEIEGDCFFSKDFSKLKNIYLSMNMEEEIFTNGKQSSKEISRAIVDALCKGCKRTGCKHHNITGEVDW